MAMYYGVINLYCFAADYVSHWSNLPCFDQVVSECGGGRRYARHSFVLDTNEVPKERICMLDKNTSILLDKFDNWYLFNSTKAKTDPTRELRAHVEREELAQGDKLLEFNFGIMELLHELHAAEEQFDPVVILGANIRGCWVNEMFCGDEVVKQLTVPVGECGVDKYHCILHRSNNRYLFNCTREYNVHFGAALRRAKGCKLSKVYLDKMQLIPLGEVQPNNFENIEMVRTGKVSIMNDGASEQFDPVVILGADNNIRTSWGNELSYVWLSLTNVPQPICAIDVSIYASDQQWGQTGQCFVKIVLRDGDDNEIISFPFGTVAREIKLFTFGMLSNDDENHQKNC